MTERGTDTRLEEYLALHRAAVEASLSEVADALPAGPISDAIRHGLLSGGKRLRPILTVAAYEACGRDVVAATYRLGAALELIHAYSLMHDDLPCMDDAELRRGAATTHIAHGEVTTIWAAAAMIPLAASTALRAARALDCDEERARRVTRILLEGAGAGGMVGGQWLDLVGEGEALEAERLDDLHRRKTGALLSSSIRVGAEAAEATQEVVDELTTYGRAIGLAFQITDDVLDATQSAEALGKNPSDTELDKSTYVSLYGLDEARRRGREQVDRALGALRRLGLESHPLADLAEYVASREK